MSHGSSAASLTTKPQQSDSQEIESLFRRLESEWNKSVNHLSSVHDIISDPAYLAIIEMGWFAVPLMLRSLQLEPDHWFEALGRITGENPVAIEDAGNMRKMADAWIKWGTAKGFIADR